MGTFVIPLLYPYYTYYTFCTLIQGTIFVLNEVVVKTNSFLRLLSSCVIHKDKNLCSLFWKYLKEISW